MDKNKILEDFKEYLESMGDNEFFEVMKEKYEAKFEEVLEDKKQQDVQNKEIQRYKKPVKLLSYKLLCIGLDLICMKTNLKERSHLW